MRGPQATRIELDTVTRRLGCVFAGLGNGIVALNAQGLIVAANPAAQRLLDMDEAGSPGVDEQALPAPWATALTDTGAPPNCASAQAQAQAPSTSSALS